jgi:hypothetical protein
MLLIIGVKQTAADRYSQDHLSVALGAAVAPPRSGFCGRSSRNSPLQVNFRQNLQPQGAFSKSPGWFLNRAQDAAWARSCKLFQICVLVGNQEKI